MFLYLNDQNINRVKVDYIFNDNEMIYVGNVMYMKCVFIIDNDI